MAALLALAAVGIFLALRPAPATPTVQTAFEQRGGSQWTTLEEERAFIARLDREDPRIRVARVGESVEGRPIRLVTVGPPATRAEIAAGPSLLLVCTQHGNEPAGREACLQEIRREAARDLPRTLLVMPTSNPDGVAADTRFNADGIDSNRDHQELATPEARAVKAVQAAYRPDITLDMHEYSEPGAEEIEHSFARNPAVRQSIRDQSQDLVFDFVEPALRAAGYRTGPYETGTRRYRSLNQVSGLRLSVPALVESPRSGPLSPRQRVAAHRTAIGGGQRMLARREGELADATR